MDAISQTLQGYMPAFLIAVTGVILVTVLRIKEFMSKNSHKHYNDESVAEGVA